LQLSSSTLAQDSERSLRWQWTQLSARNFIVIAS